MDTTNTTVIILAVVVAFIIGGMLGILMNGRQRTKRLQDKFGSEYERTVNDIGDTRQAEHNLESRLDHVRTLDIRPLSTNEIDRFTHDWKMTQAEFVDEPLRAMQKSDRLIREVMKAKGYPVEDFEQRVADISVDYPELVADYRGLHLIALKGANEAVSTEEMRQAMIHSRALFENLVDNDADMEATHQHHEKERI